MIWTNVLLFVLFNLSLSILVTFNAGIVFKLVVQYVWLFISFNFKF